MNNDMLKEANILSSKIELVKYRLNSIRFMEDLDPVDDTFNLASYITEVSVPKDLAKELLPKLRLHYESVLSELENKFKEL